MLEVDGLVGGYDGTRVLHGLSLRVAAGGVTALLGGNGAGKTTLMKTLAGLLPVRSGRLRFLGEDITQWPSNERVHAGLVLVPEGRMVFPSLTVRENLQLAARNGRKGAWTIDRLMQEFPVMQAFQHRPATALSGGQQQLVALSRALVCNPSYLLCDEISLGLSPLAVNEVYELLGRARGEGLAVVLVEQNVKRALAESDRYYCIQKGRVVLEGASERADQAQVAQAYFGI
jgi:branched-chain amino acid transport system ATP-binding protein